MTRPRIAFLLFVLPLLLFSSLSLTGNGDVPDPKTASVSYYGVKTELEGIWDGTTGIPGETNNGRIIDGPGTATDYSVSVHQPYLSTEGGLPISDPYSYEPQPYMNRVYDNEQNKVRIYSKWFYTFWVTVRTYADIDYIEDPEWLPVLFDERLNYWWDPWDLNTYQNPDGYWYEKNEVMIPRVKFTSYETEAITLDVSLSFQALFDRPNFDATFIDENGNEYSLDDVQTMIMSVRMAETATTRSGKINVVPAIGPSETFGQVSLNTADPSGTPTVPLTAKTAINSNVAGHPLDPDFVNQDPIEQKQETQYSYQKGFVNPPTGGAEDKTKAEYIGDQRLTLNDAPQKVVLDFSVRLRPEDWKIKQNVYYTTFWMYHHFDTILGIRQATYSLEFREENPSPRTTYVGAQYYNYYIQIPFVATVVTCTEYGITVPPSLPDGSIPLIPQDVGTEQGYYLDDLVIPPGEYESADYESNIGLFELLGIDSPAEIATTFILIAIIAVVGIYAIKSFASRRSPTIIVR